MSEKFKELEEKVNGLLEEYRKNPTEEKKNEIVLANMGLVAKAAIKIFSNYKIYNKNIESVLELNDLLNDAVVGMKERIIDGYDPGRGYKFITYAYKAVWNYLHNKINEIAGDSAYWESKITNFGRLIEKYKKEDKTLTVDEAAKKLHISKESARNMMINYCHSTVSLFSIVNSEGGEEFLINMIGDKRDDFKHIYENEIRKEVRDAIDIELTGRLKEVLELIYYNKLSHAEAGNILGVNDSRIGQLIEKAKEKIRKKLEEHKEFLLY